MKHRPIVLQAVDNFPNYEAQANLPELGLLAAILERSYRDLEPCEDRHNRRRAIAWFEAKLVDPLGISFKNVIEGLSLGETQLVVIRRKVAKAKAYHDELYRKDSELAEE